MINTRDPKNDTETSKTTKVEKNPIDAFLDAMVLERAKQAAAELAKAHPNAKTFTCAPVARACPEHGIDLGILVQSPESPTAKTVVQRPMAMMFSLPATAPAATADTKNEAAPTPKSPKK